jgi:hypothetical protein
VSVAAIKDQNWHNIDAVVTRMIAHIGDILCVNSVMNVLWTMMSFSDIYVETISSVISVMPMDTIGILG